MYRWRKRRSRQIGCGFIRWDSTEKTIVASVHWLHLIGLQALPGPPFSVVSSVGIAQKNLLQLQMLLMVSRLSARMNMAKCRNNDNRLPPRPNPRIQKTATDVDQYKIDLIDYRKTDVSPLRASTGFCTTGDGEQRHRSRMHKNNKMSYNDLCR